MTHPIAQAHLSTVREDDRPLFDSTGFNNEHLDSVVYVHDPMCSWCWAFRPTLKQLQQNLPENVGMVRLLGGLAPDSNEPMPEMMRQSLQRTWRDIAYTVPGTPFNFQFWSSCIPRRSTYPACRAVIAARNQGTEWEGTMTEHIQRAYYLDARNPSDDRVLREIAASIGLDAQRFAEDLNSQQTQNMLHQEIALSRKLGVSGFPALLFNQGDAVNRLPVDYARFSTTLKAIRALLKRA